MSGGGVVFDLGQVLIRWDRRALFAGLIADDVELDHFLDEVLTLEANADVDRGDPLQDVVDRLAKRHPAHRELLQAFADRWIETLGDVIDGSVAVLDELVALGTPVYALTNWGRETFEQAASRMPFLAAFDGIVVSGREGVVKPEPAIFELLCSRYRLEPRRCVFIDDSPANVAAAERLGFDAVLFTDPQQLRRDLVERRWL